MSWSYSTIGDYVNQSDIARKDIISSCNSIGLQIPTDQERVEQGVDPIRLSEIPNWLYRDVAIRATTVNTSKYQLNTSLKTNFPDLTVDWGDGTVSAVSQYQSNIIIHNYLSSGSYTIKYMSKKIDMLTDSAFNSDGNITSVQLSPTVTKIGDYAFYQASKLSSICGYDNVRSIGKGAFRGTNLTGVTLPDCTLSIYAGAFTIYKLNSFNISKSSKLKYLQDSAFGSVYYLKQMFIPKECIFYSTNNDSIIQPRVQPWKYSNPFVDCRAVISVDNDNPYYCSDLSGCVFIKDSDGFPRDIIYIPTRNNYFKKGYEFPQTLKVIRGHSLSYYNTTNIQNASKAEIIRIGKDVEYISPQFLGDGSCGSRLSIDENNQNYKTGDWGEIYTWRYQSDIGDISKRTTILQIDPQTDTELSIPEYCSQIYDFYGQSTQQAMMGNWSSNITSKLQTMYLNKSFPKTTLNVSPSKGFKYLNGTNCDNYSISNRQLYRKIEDNDYASVVKIPTDDTEVVIHEKCYNMEQRCFSGSNASSLNLDNISGYVNTCTFLNMKNIGRIQFGNGIVGIDGHMCFSGCAKLSSIIVGRDQNSKLYNLKATAFIDYPMPSMKNIVIYSPNVSTDIDSTFFRVNSTGIIDIDLFIPIWKRDQYGSYTNEHTQTYQKFYSFGLNEYTRNINNGCLIRDISCWNG